LYVVGDLGVEVYQSQKIKIQLKLLKMQLNMANGFNVVIVDTAGRLAVDQE
jgi:signal recognition particle GTPase